MRCLAENAVSGAEQPDAHEIAELGSYGATSPVRDNFYLNVCSSIPVAWRLSTVFLLFVVVAVQCFSEEILDQRLMLLAGKGPVDCGTVQVEQDPLPASKCAKQALASKKSFVVRYRLPGNFDSD